MNFRAFQEKLPELVATHAGKVAVMRDGEIVEFFDSYPDAVRYGQRNYGGFGEFSLQEVTNCLPSLGFYSNAIGAVC